MTQIGIGELKHAKSNNTVQKQQSPISKVKREHPAPPKKEAAQEGQLSVDIVQTENEMIIVCPMAGVAKNGVKISIQEDVLTIRGEREPLKAIQDKQVLVRELFWGPFSRSIVLPDHIDRKNIEARFHENMLSIRIPKTEDFKTRIIHIND